MTKHPPNRRGITFEVGAQLEARDRLKKWYAAHIEEIDYEEGKVLIHFKRWNHRYDEWFCWDSPYLRPLEKIQLRKEGLVEEEPQVVFRVNEQVLACWSDCRFYPAKVTSVNKDGTYTVKFFDGVIQTVKNIHVKSFSKDQANVSRPKPREKVRESTSPPDKHRGKFKEQKKTSENTNIDKEKAPAPDKKPAQPEKEKKPPVCDKSKIPEKSAVKNEKEDKENISENEREPSGEAHPDERNTPNDSVRAPHEKVERRAAPHEKGERNAAPHEKVERRAAPHEKGERNAAPHENGERRAAPHENGERKAAPHEKGERNSAPHENGERKAAPHENGERRAAPHEKEERKAAPHENGERRAAPHEKGERKAAPHEKGERKAAPHEKGERKAAPHEKGERKAAPHENGERRAAPHEKGERKAAPHENGERRKKRDKSSSAPPSDAVSQTLQPVTLELRRRKISIGLEVQTKRARLDKSSKKNNSVDETSKVENGVSVEEPQPDAEEICEKETSKEPSMVSSVEREEKPTDIEKTTVPPAAEEESSQEPDPVSMEPQEVKTEISPATEPELPETKPPPPLDEIVEPAIADLPSSPPDIKLEETEPPAQNEAQEVASVTVPMKRNPRSDSSTKYSREPLTNTLKKSDDPAPRAVTMELDPNMFKCKFLDCSKSFRKAKLLHYHMKYFHGIEKAEQDQTAVTRPMQTRGSLAHEKANQETPKRRRTSSGSLHGPLQVSLRSSPHDGKAERLGEKRRHSMQASYSSNVHRPSLKEKSKENQIQKSHGKLDKQSESVKDKDKTKEKLKDSMNLKSKKRKKKKKKSKLEISGSEENIDISKELSPKKMQPVKPNNDLKPSCPVKNTPLKSSDHGRHKETARISDEETLSDSCTESLLWSEDDDFNEEIDVTNADEELEEDYGDCEIVRCMCEVQEENDFMIQCEDCLCWQHGVCMGLLEENVPEKYTCYICQDPPGQRLSLKYWYDKEWLNKGHMHGLSFLEENYSHQNARKIVATHQLLGDVQRVIEVLHGLQLKMSILQSKEHPDLKYWGQPWKQHMMNDKCYIRRRQEENSCKEDSTHYRTYNGAADKPSPIPSVEESYITSEHCYQKPRTYYPAVEQRLVVETRSSTLDGGVDRIQQSREDSIAERLGWELDRELIKTESESKHNYCKVRECLSKRNPPQESTHAQPTDNGDGGVSSQLQWQLNLLAHLESLQDEVTHRMDFIEKELDVLESFLDYTGELEPPEPLARLPQLKHRIKQLLTDLGKVEQIALCCST